MLIISLAYYYATFITFLKDCCSRAELVSYFEIIVNFIRNVSVLHKGYKTVAPLC